MPQYQRVDIYFDNNVQWGSSWANSFRAVYSNQRGWLLYVNEATRTFRNFTGTTVNSNEYLTCYNRS